MKRVLEFSIVGFMFLLTGLVSQAQQAATSGQSLGTATITGGGTTNYIPIWTSASTLGNSVIFQKSGTVGIGTTNPLPNFKLDVNGSVHVGGNVGAAGTISAANLVAGSNLAVFDALTVQGNITGSCLSFPSANLIGGSNANSVSNGVTGATIGGGGSPSSGNRVISDFGTVSGGLYNVAGSDTTCAAPYATVAGGASNTASGRFSTVAGGDSNTASGDFSFAAGILAKAKDFGSFVWCEAEGTPCTSLGTNSFQVAVNGPIYFFDGPNGSGCNLSEGGGSWNCSSDRSLKDDITPIDSRSVLEHVAQLPITQWKMKAERSGAKHIGPMAQDFYAAFGLGDDDRYIALGDGQGVALAAIQALYKVVHEKDQQIQELQQRLELLEQMAPKYSVRN
jgi:hypothetical protein